MSYCVTINNLEHLPAEETLLIHYNISCSGIWDLNQLATAYRNVCASGWTVMYPNHQHPRHSDFPINVTSSANATFAWNYGGIQGIEPQNFDETHSYLVQLSVYDYVCSNSGQFTGSGDPTSGEITGTGGATGTGGGGGRIPGVPKPRPGGGGGGGPGGPTFSLKPAPPPAPPPGGGGGPGGPARPKPAPAPAPGGGGGGGGPATGGPFPSAKPPTGPGGGAGPATGGIPGPSTGGPVGPAKPIPTGPTTGGPSGIVKPVPTGPAFRPGGGLILPVPTTGPNGGILLPGGSVPPTRLPLVPQAEILNPNTGDPTNYSRAFQYIYPVPFGSNPGTQEPNTLPGTNVTQQNNSYILGFTRQEATNGFTTQSIPGTSQISTKTFYPEGADAGLQEEPLGVNYRQVQPLGEGYIIGNLEKQIINTNQEKFTQKTNQSVTKNLDKNANLQLFIGKEDVSIGEPIVVSTVFKSKENIKARIVIEAQDKARLVTFVESAVLPASEQTPLTSGTSINSSVFSSSPIIVTSKVFSENGSLIAIKSAKVTVTSPRLEGTVFNSKSTDSTDIPDKITRDAKLSSSVVPLELKHNSSTFVILESDSDQEEFSSVLQCDNITDDKYSLSSYNLANGIDDVVSGSYVSGAPELYSEKGYFIDGQDYKPGSHTAALSNSNIAATSSILLEISPAINNTPVDTKGNLHLHEKFRLRKEAFTATAGSQTVTGSVPFVNEKYALIVNGRTSQNVPSNYTENSTISNTKGQVSWSGLSLTVGDHYSIVKAQNGIINPFSEPVFRGVVT